MTASDRPDPATLLGRYNEMRDFDGTPEPAGEGRPRDGHLRFVVQKHDASQLHYDFRLEMDGVLKSWSIPKGPSLNPAERRLAMETEDHPIAYAAFEGHIPEGHYGAGDVIVWDHGVYYPQDKQLDRIPEDEAEATASAGYASGEIKFELAGEKLRGSWAIVRMKGRGEGNWLLIKHNDDFADREHPVADQKQSVVTGALLPRDQGGPSTAQRRAARKRTTTGKDQP